MIKRKVRRRYDKKGEKGGDKDEEKEKVHVETEDRRSRECYTHRLRNSRLLHN